MSTEEFAQPSPGEQPAEQERAEPATVEQQIQNEREKAERYLANWQRAQADFVNYKRRAEAERADAGRIATAALIINLLPVIDDLERALHNVDATLAGLNWVDGIRLIERKFRTVLEAAGVSDIPAEGQDFDPNVHEAVTYGDGPEGKVIHEVQRGYRLGDRVVRPAMVVVGKGTGAGNESDESARSG